MRSAVQEDILHTGIGKELERIFNQGSVRKRQETLKLITLRQPSEYPTIDAYSQRSSTTTHTLGFSSVNGSNLVSKVSAST